MRKVVKTDVHIGALFFCLEDADDPEYSWAGYFGEVTRTSLNSVELTRDDVEDTWHVPHDRLFGWQDGFAFAPISELSDKDLFHYKMTGRLPNHG